MDNDRTTPSSSGVNNEESFELPNLSFDSSALNLPSPPSLLHRPGYQRISSIGEVDSEYHGNHPVYLDSESIGNNLAESGLAITNLGGQQRFIPRKASSKSIDGTPRSTDFLLSPSSTRVGAGNDSSEFGHGFEHHPDKSGASPVHRPFEADSDTEHLTPKTAPSIRSSFTSDFDPPSQCKASKDFQQGRGHWLSLSILVLAIYSTIFSGIWVVIALVKPRYGERVTSTGQLSPGTASLLTAAFAKSIELSFVTVFVAYLGQTLSRRALVKNLPGISIAEMSFPSWIVQPGTLITHWQNVHHAGGTLLGTVALTAATMAIFYTTASDALVTPQLKMGMEKSQLMYGRVATQFANPFYIQEHCQTPIPLATDAEAARTCIQIEHAGQAYHNYMQWLGSWRDSIDTGNGSSELINRPRPTAMLYDNTTVVGSWIHTQNMTEVSKKYERIVDNVTYERIVNNVSMAMPHSGVFGAARDPINRILQPKDLSGLGEYTIGASVPSSVVNVLCATVEDYEIAPLVYSTWPNATTNPLNSSNWPNSYGIPTAPSWLNQTPVDDLFGFGEKYNRRPPVFPKFPIPYNTVLNSTAYQADALYLLATAADSSYVLCSLAASLTPNCSTYYHSSMSGGELMSHCNDPNNPLAYSKSYPNATNGIRNRDWVNLGTLWALSLALNGGISDHQAANARLLTQVIPKSTTLDTSLPSIAESLAVLAGSTLLQSTLDSPFIHFWNYSTTVATLKNPQYQAFNATFRYADYASGGTQPWQNIFHIVLILVFFTNIFCLVHFIFSGGLVTDYIEPQNLFALAMNSPPNRELAGSCGAGPEHEQFRVKWAINYDTGHLFIENRDAPTRGKRRRVAHVRSGTGDTESNIGDTPSRLSLKKWSLI